MDGIINSVYNVYIYIYIYTSPLTLCGTHVSKWYSPMTNSSSNAAHVDDSTVCVTMLIACLALSRRHVGSRIKRLVCILLIHSGRRQRTITRCLFCVPDEAPPIHPHPRPFTLSSSSSISNADTTSTRILLIYFIPIGTLLQSSPVPLFYYNIIRD